MVSRIVTPPATSSRIACHMTRRLRGSRPGRRLVEEDDPRVADEGHREVEPAAHAAGVRRGGLARRLDEVEPLEQLRDAAAALLAAEVAQVRDEAEVLLARELLVDGRDLAGDADQGADGIGSVATS